MDTDQRSATSSTGTDEFIESIFELFIRGDAVKFLNCFRLGVFSFSAVIAAMFAVIIEEASGACKLYGGFE